MLPRNIWQLLIPTGYEHARVIFCVSALLLAACGGGGASDEAGNDSHSSPPGTVTGAAVKGPFLGSSIKLHQHDNQGQISDPTPLATTNTNSEGNFSTSALPGGQTALIGVSGGGFYDESDPQLERFISWPEAEELLGFLPAGATSAAITPLTDRLVRKSRTDAATGLGFAHSVEENRRLAGLAYGFDPVSVIPPNPTNPFAGASQAQLQYAMYLGGIANAVNTVALRLGLQAPDFDVLHLVLLDMEDCLLDGKLFGATLDYNGQALPTDVDLQAEIERFRNNYFDKLGSAPLVNINAALCADKLPMANDDSATTNEDTAINIAVLANDSDPDGTLIPASIEITASPQHGQLSIGSSGAITYTPSLNYFGSDVFGYRVQDNLGARTNIATVNLTVIDVNDLPVANNDARIVLEDSGATSIDVLANDTDVDGTIIRSTLQMTSGPVNGTASINTAHDIVYTPNANFNGTDSIGYRVSDDDGALSNLAALTITVGAVNDPPVISDIPDQSISEDTNTGPLPFNVDDLDQSAGSLSITGSSNNASLVPNGNIVFGGSGMNRTVTITSVANAFGSAIITVTVTDATGGSASDSFTVTVSPVNDPPTAVNDAFTLPEDSAAVLLDVLLNDSISPDTGESLSLVSVTPGNQGGSVSISGGNISYQPKADFSGTETFSYVVDDGTPGSNSSAIVTITVTPLNDPPIVQPDSYSVEEGGTLNGASVLDNDTDPDNDPLTAEPADGPTNASSFTLHPDGTFSYTHNGMESTSDSFSYRANDGSDSSGLVTVTISIIPVDDAPVAIDDSYVVPEDGFVNGNVRDENDSDADTPLANVDVMLVTGPSFDDAEGFFLDVSGNFGYAPGHNFHGEDSFTYKLNDGTSDSNVATATITITPVNDPPAVDDQSFSVDENSPNGTVLGTMLASDPDSGDVISFSFESGNIDDAFAINSSTGEITVNSSAALDHEAMPDFSLVVKVQDQTEAFDTGLANITVEDLNEAPVAADDSFRTRVNTSFDSSQDGGEVSSECTDCIQAVVLEPPFSLLNNDSDPDGDFLTVSGAAIGVPLMLTTTAGGSVSIYDDGTITYEPPEDYVGPDSFMYQATDGALDSNLAIVNIDVTAEPPNVWGVKVFDVSLVSFNADSGEIYSDKPIILSNGPISGAVTRANGLTYDASTGHVYAVLQVNSIETESTIRILATIDLATAEATSIGDLGDKFSGLTVDDSGTLYGVTGDGASSCKECLYTINKTTGQATFVMNLGNGLDGEAIAFNPMDGLIYHASGNSTPPVFEKVDPFTQAITNIPFTGETSQEVLGMVYDGSRGRFVFTDINFEIFLVEDTGAAVHVASFAEETSVRGLAILHGTDSDGDGLPDAFETNLGTNPSNEDSDNDGLTDGEEVNFHGTDPNNRDTDGDGVKDSRDRFPLQVAECTAPPANMVAWWSGDGHADDILGGHHGSLTGGATNVAGFNDQAFSFPGSGSAVTIPDSPDFQLTESLTIDAWIRVDSTPGTQGQILFRGDSRSGFDPYFMAVSPDPGPSGGTRLGMVIQNASNQGAGVSTGIEEGEFVHVVGMLDGSTGDMSLFVDGQLANQNNTSIRPLGPLTGSNPGLAIGNLQASPFGQRFPGVIDEVELFSRTLTPAEIENLYQAGVAGKCKPTAFRVNSHVPVANSTSAPVDVMPDYIFTGDVDQSTFDASTMVVHAGTGKIPFFGSTPFFPDPDRAIFEFPQALRAGQKVQLSATGGILENITEVPLIPHVAEFRAAVTGPGIGQFSIGSSFSPNHVADIDLGDLDGDGDLDIIRVWERFLNNGDGTFGPSANIGALHGRRVLADIDNDGDLDIIRTDGSVLITYLNDGSANFSTHQSGIPLAGPSANGDYSNPLAADFNGDGFMDIAAGSRAGSHPVSSILLNQGDGTYGPKLDAGSKCAATSKNRMHAAGDIDNDGDIDLLLACHSATGGHRVLFNDGSANFTEGPSLGGTSGIVELGDFDDDGDLDYVYGADTNSTSLEIRLNNGDGTFSARSFVGSGMNPWNIRLGDLDSDGDLDISLVTNAQPNSKIFINDGNAGFTESVGANPDDNNASDHDIGDVDGDGDLDIVKPDTDGSSTRVLLNQGDADGDGLHDAQEIALGTNPNDADSDDDGLNDGDEVNVHGTDPLLFDSDDDGVGDGDEVNAVPATDPLLADRVCTQPPLNMEAWWPGEGDATDIQGGNNGTPESGAGFATGRVGQAFSFDGVDDRIKINSTGIFKGQAEATIDAWVKPMGAHSNEGNVGGAVFVENTSTADSTRLGLFVYNDGRVLLSGRTGEIGTRHDALTTDVIATGRWTHLAATWHATEGLRVYINGVEAAFTSAAPGAFSATDSTLVAIGGAGPGSVSNDAENVFNGQIDEVEVFTRTLSATEIRSLYMAGNAGKCTDCTPAPSDMVAWYPGDRHTDDIQSTHHGAFMDGASRVAGSYIAGMAGDAFSLDGVNDYIQIPDSPDLYPGTGSFTYDVWFKTAVNSGIILSRNEKGGAGSGAIDGSMYYLQVTTDGKLLGGLREAGAAGIQQLTSPARVDDGVLHHAAFVRDVDASQLLLYLDGQLVSSQTMGTSTDGPIGDEDGLPDPLVIGAIQFSNSDNFGNYFNGVVDEVEYFNRALSIDEIGHIYNARSRGKCKPFCPGVSLVDPWDVAKGTVITSHSPTLFGSPINGIFGGPGFSNSGDTLFEDNNPEGHANSVIWQTPSSLNIARVRLHLVQDTIANLDRSVKEVRLYAWNGGIEDFDLIYQSKLPLPYTPTSNQLFRCINVPVMSTNQYRAEFIQGGPADPNSSGSRVRELDGYDAIDLDADGLTNAEEAGLDTDPYNPDTDGDGITDFEEVNVDGNPADYNPGAGDTDPKDPNSPIAD